MSLDKIVELATANWGWVIILLLSLVEVSKIQINPWSSLFKWIGNIFMSDVRTDISDIKKKLIDVEEKINTVKDETQENEAKIARARILTCSDEVYQGERHSKEYFDNILADITQYKRYCTEHPEFKNEITVLATERIEEVYQRCLKCHEFL